MSGPSYSISFNGVATEATTTPISVGDVVCRDSSGEGFVAATSSALLTAGLVSGIARTATSTDDTTFEIQYEGEVPASVTGLGTGTVSYVGVSSNRLARQSYEYNSVGICDAYGNMMLRNVYGEDQRIGDITDLSLWLRADYGVTESSGAVSQWSDQSGNARHFVQATAANQPTYAASQLSGLAGVTFDGTNDVLTCTATLANILDTSPSGEFTSFIVHRWVSFGTNAGNTYDNDCVICDAGGYWGYHSKSTGNTYAYHSPSADASAAQPLPAGVDACATWGWDGVKLFHSVGDTTPTAYAGTSPASVLTNTLRLGQNYSSAYANVRVYELLVFARSLTASERRQVRDYLRRKWGV